MYDRSPNTHYLIRTCHGQIYGDRNGTVHAPGNSKQLPVTNRGQPIGYGVWQTSGNQQKHLEFQHGRSDENRYRAWKTSGNYLQFPVPNHDTPTGSYDGAGQASGNKQQIPATHRGMFRVSAYGDAQTSDFQQQTTRKWMRGRDNIRATMWKLI